MGGKVGENTININLQIFLIYNDLQLLEFQIMNKCQSFSPLEISSNFQINRRPLKLSSAINRLKELPSKPRGLIQNPFNNFCSNDPNLIKEEIKKEKEKENYGFHIEAFKMNLNKNPENILQQSQEQQPKPVQLQSRSFKIRFNCRKASSKKIQIERPLETHEKSLTKKKQKIVQKLQQSDYESTFLKEISEPVNLSPKEINAAVQPAWAIFIPACLLINETLNIRQLLEKYKFKEAEIFIKANNEQEYQKISYLGKCFNILQPQRNVIVEQSIFASFSAMSTLPPNLLMIDLVKDYPVWYPYLTQKVNQIIFIRAKNLQFLKNIVLQEDGIKFITQKEVFCHQLNDQALNEKINFLRKARKHKKKRRSSQESVQENNTLEDFQEKMIKYIKILQKEKGEKSTTTSKSPYQVINDMVRNNRKINKQVQGYVSETQGLTLPSLITNQLQLKLNYYCFD